MGSSKTSPLSRFLHIVIFIAVPALLVLAGFLIGKYGNIEIWSIMLALIAIAISVLIAYNQQIQLSKLRIIGAETSETARELRTASAIRSVVRVVFMLSDPCNKMGDRFRCLYTHEFKDHPLPYINIAAYSALQILTHRLGEERVELRGIMAGEEFLSDPTQGIVTEKGIPSDLTRGNVILLGHRTAGTVIRSYLPEGWPDYDHEATDAPLELPCWLVTETENLSSGASIDNTIIIIREGHAKSKKITSPAHPRYRDAAERGPGKGPQVAKAQDDYGIFARLHVKDCRYVILTGMHAYGTWIVGEFLDRLLRGENMTYRDVFLGKEDFISIVWGEVDEERLKVVRTMVHHDFLWTGGCRKWRRISAAT